MLLTFDSVPGWPPMEEFIARENIRRFEARLESCTDDSQRAEIEALLHAERKKLHAIRQAKIIPQLQGS